MRALALDTETTTHNKGAPYDSRNWLVCISWAHNFDPALVVRGASRITPELIAALQKLVDEADVIIGFNFKFDLHWLKKAGLRLDHKRIYDCQVAEFVIERQQNAYPSLNESAAKYSLGQKRDVVKEDYWDKGICTSEIPWPILRDYATQDADLTLRVYEAQKAHITPLQRRLLSLLNEDLKILQEMEQNGICFNEALCDKRGAELQKRIDESRATLNAVYPDVPINWASGDQLSAFLYGGTIKEATKVHDGFFKTGTRKGEPKYKNVEVEHQLPRLYQPLRGSEMAKEGFYSTSEDTLLKLKGKQGPLTILLELSKMEKLLGTYYAGLPKLNALMHWPRGMLHGTFNQCVAATGRLSSTKPNLQNFASELKDVFISRN